MKRSEFVARLNDHESPWVTDVVAIAEAAGVVWDPEEEPLPERLTVFSDRAIGMQYGPEGSGWVKAGYVYPDHEHVAREAVRRWNVWGEIRRLVESALWPPSTIKNALLAILDGAVLDGKEGQA